MEHANGDQEAIVGGIYRRFKTGTFVKTHGRKMVAVDVDRNQARNMWMSGIAPLKKKPKDVNVVLSRHEYDELLQDIASMATSLERLQLKVKSHDK